MGEPIPRLMENGVGWNDVSKQTLVPYTAGYYFYEANR
jgi:hypothetical protein